MIYTLTEATNKQQRNDFIVENFSFYTFWSSREAWEFHSLEWSEVYRYCIYEKQDVSDNSKKKELVGLIQLIKVDAKRGSFFLSQHGPLIKKDYFTVLKNIMPEVQKIARNHNASFLRINGLTKNTRKNYHEYKNIWFRYSPLHVSAEEMHLLYLDPREEQLKANMRKTTRYMINRGIKEWVVVKKSNEAKRIKAFVELHHKHAARTNGKRQYHAYSHSYITNLFKAFDQTQIHLFDASYNDQVEATVISIEFGKHAAYYLWASDIKHPKFSPAYAAQWAAITHAKKAGCSAYNFWWVAPDENKKHPLYGVWLFKRGFWWKDYFLTHAHDYVFSRKYWITFFIETLRRYKRGYYYPKPQS